MSMPTKLAAGSLAARPHKNSPVPQPISNSRGLSSQKRCSEAIRGNWSGLWYNSRACHTNRYLEAVCSSGGVNFTWRNANDLRVMGEFERWKVGRLEG